MLDLGHSVIARLMTLYGEIRGGVELPPRLFIVDNQGLDGKMISEWALNMIRGMAEERKAKWEEDEGLEYLGSIFQCHVGSALYSVHCDQNGQVTKIITPEGDALRLK